MVLFKLFLNYLLTVFHVYFCILNRDPENSHFQITDSELLKYFFRCSPKPAEFSCHCSSPTPFFKRWMPLNLGPHWMQCQEETNCTSLPQVSWFAQGKTGWVSKKQYMLQSSRIHTTDNQGNRVMGALQSSPKLLGTIILISPFSGSSSPQSDKCAADL